MNRDLRRYAIMGWALVAALGVASVAGCGGNLGHLGAQTTTSSIGIQIVAN